MEIACRESPLARALRAPLPSLVGESEGGGAEFGIRSRSPYADCDPERVAQREVLIGDREHDELLQLVLRREVAGLLRLRGDDLLRDLEIPAEQEPGARGGDL